MSRVALAARPAIAVVLAVLGAWALLQLPTVTADAQPNTAAVPLTAMDDITMESQQHDEWCWAAGGATIAEYWGYGIDQNHFCGLAHDVDVSTEPCPNTVGDLAQVKHGFDKLGFAGSGTFVHQPLSFADIQRNIAMNEPVETRIGWTAGGGHMHVIYGYDSTGGTQVVDFGDPWPSDQRYNSMDYSSYVKNKDFSWTHSLSGIDPVDWAASSSTAGAR
ncbi:MAG: papain-like cysteine protease family protein [Sciscionella sp.]